MIVADARGKPLNLTFAVAALPGCRWGPNNDEKDTYPMGHLNLALPHFGLIFIGFACGKGKGLPEAGLAWMNFFLLYVSLPALLFGIMSKTPFEELNNPPFLIATTLGTTTAFFLALFTGRLLGRLPLREATPKRSPHCFSPTMTVNSAAPLSVRRYSWRSGRWR